MTRSRWIWAASLLLALVLGGVLGVRWWGQGPPPPPAAPPSPPAAEPAPRQPDAAEAPFLKIEGTRLSGTDPEGRRVWDLRAETLSVDRGQQRIVMTAVTGQFYQDGRSQLTFTAPRARFAIASRDVELSGGVVARTPDGRTLRAATVHYSGGQRTLTATGDVVLTQTGLSIRADALRTDPALEQPRFSGNIVVRVTE